MIGDFLTNASISVIALSKVCGNNYLRHCLRPPKFLKQQLGKLDELLLPPSVWAVDLPWM